MRKTLLPLLGLSALAASAVTSGCFGGSTPLDVPPPNVIDDDPDDKKPLDVGGVPAIQGGTLLILDDGFTALAADPARDKLFFADLKTHKLLNTIDLNAGDQPGRAVQDADGTVHVALRRGGAIVSVTPSGKLLSRRDVCPAPSGIDYDAEDNMLHVACATGELVSLSASGGGVTRTLHLSPDLRDVVVYQGGGDTHLLVSRFRQADVLVIDHDGAWVRTIALPETFNMLMQPVKPTVAWRLRGMPDGRVFMLHQRSQVGEIQEGDGGYTGEMCGGPVVTVVSEIDPTYNIMPEPEMAVPGSLATDFQWASHEEQFVLAATGFSWTEGLPRLIRAWDVEDPIGCNFSVEADLFGASDGEITAVAYDSNNRWIAQSREPAMLILETGERISLSTESRYDEGLALFHKAPMASVTCASCHPGGGDDGHVWVFSQSGARRTQSLAGTLAGTAPYHWDASMETLNTIMNEVFVGRMLGEPLSNVQQIAFTQWMESIPAPPTPTIVDKAAVQRGKQLFEDGQVGCASCHAGDKLTNNKSYDVGTGGVFQVPSLIGVGSRTTFMHDGCAPTLADRFTPGCGGNAHGKIGHLDAGDLNDLVAYMKTL